MTVDSRVYLYFFVVYGKAWRRLVKPHVSRDGRPYPLHYIPWNDFNPRTNVLLIDGTMKLKYISSNIATGIDFMKNQFLKESLEFLKTNHGGTVIFCLDTTPRQINKHVNSNKKPKTACDIPVNILGPSGVTERIIDRKKINKDQNYEIDDHSALVDNDTIPSAVWDGFISNKQLYPELIHYITSYLIDPKSVRVPKDHVVEVPRDKRFYLWGGNLHKPPPRSVREKMDVLDILKTTFEGSVFYIGNSLNESTGQYEKTSGRCAPTTFRLDVLEGLKEAEMVMLYFMTAMPNENFTLLSGDRDVIFLLLLHSKDRKDPATGFWRNQVFLRLVKKKTNQVDLDEPMVEEIDINLLYDLIQADSRINMEKGINNPHLFLTALNALITSDFIYGYGSGVGNINIDPATGKRINTTHSKKEKDAAKEDPNNPILTSIPTILYTFLSNPPKYKDLFQVMVGEAYRDGIPFRVVPIRINETVFIQFTRDCYYHKYLKETSNALGKSESNITVTDVRTYLAKYRGMNGKTKQLPKTKNERMMTQSKIRIICRNLWWTMEYWQNKYRQNGTYPLPPTIQYKGLPLYGWVQTGFTSAKRSTKVSPLIHVDLEYVELDGGKIEDVVSEPALKVMKERRLKMAQ